VRKSRWTVVMAFGLLAAGVWLVPAPAAADALGELLVELQIIPVPDQAPPAFTLDSLNGAPVSLADLRGRAVVLYFWEST
jgi:cytochrome oxidase Cu insertion factor (SCO1/SenC/PrrC family)